MTDYASVRSNWWALLNWHLKENGTRPDGTPDALGKVWDDSEFALACGVGDPTKPEYAARTVLNWCERLGIVALNLKPKEKALMGDNPAYAAWRRDLRAAHGKAPKERRDSQKIREPVPPIAIPEPAIASDEPINSEVFAFVVREGLLIRLRDAIHITPDFFHQLWLQCCHPGLISAITDPKQDLNDGESLMGKLLAYLVVPALRTKEWSSDELNAVVDEAGHHMHRLMLRKARDVGLFSMQNGKYVVSDDALDGVVYNLFGRLSDKPAKRDIYRQTYESWKDVTKVAVESMPEEDKRYIDILALFMYSIAFDNGSIDHSADAWEAWRAEDSALRADH